MEEATKLIFESKLCTALDHASLSLAGLTCFMEYFRFVSPLPFPLMSHAFFLMVSICRVCCQLP